MLASVITPVLIHYLPGFLPPSGLQSFLPRDEPRAGVTIVAACANRHPMLGRALVTWLQVTIVRQILIVDWSSSPPLHETIDALVDYNAPLFVNVTPPDIRIIRVNDESAWVLSRAYNLAIDLAQYETILKVDCDYLLHPEVALSHVVPKETATFYAGSEASARSLNEMYLNGLLIVHRDLFRSIGGYDERIQTYGYEDEDLYARLSTTGAIRRNVSYDMIDHILHHDSSRVTNDMPFPRVQREVNHMLLQRVNIIWNATQHRSKYTRVGGDRNILRAISVPADLRTLVSPDSLETIQRTAITGRLHDDFGIPSLLITSLSARMMETLLHKVSTQREGIAESEVAPGDMVVGGAAVQETGNAELMVIHVQNGIGNRLRVLGSGLAFAEATERVPIVIWERDEQFGALFDDVFNMSYVKYAVSDEFSADWPLVKYADNDATWNDFVFHNYMLEDDVGREIKDVPGKNIYFKSSAIMRSAVTTWENENDHIRQLVVNDDIETIVNKAFKKLNALHIGGVHIRNRSLDFDIPGMKPKRSRQFYYEKDMELIDKWRAFTTLSNFVPIMKQMLNNKTVSHFFVASDTVAVCKKLSKMFHASSISYIDRQCDDRGPECIKFAMADLIVLSRTKPLLGSTWSSFTEAAMRLGGPKALLAGTDFGERPGQPKNTVEKTTTETSKAKNSKSQKPS